MDRPRLQVGHPVCRRADDLNDAILVEYVGVRVLDRSTYNAVEALGEQLNFFEPAQTLGACSRRSNINATYP